MVNNKNSTQTSFEIQVVTFQYQLLDDLYFSSVSQKEMDEIDDVKGSEGLCGSHITENGDIIFFIFVSKDLDPDICLKVFCDEFYHYCINRVVYKWLDPQPTGEVPLLTSFVSEMLSHKACWNCKHLGSITCWKHPNNVIHIPIDESLDDELFSVAALKRLNMIKQALKECLFIKMYDIDDFTERESTELSSSLTFLHKLQARARISKKTKRGIEMPIMCRLRRCL